MKIRRDDFLRMCREGRAACKSWRQIAKESGIDRRGFYRRLKLALDSGDLTDSIQPQLAINGRSTLSRLDPETGEKTPILVWDKEGKGRQTEAILRALVDDLAEEVRGKACAMPAPDWVDDEHCNIVPFGDPHVGLYAWSREAGDDFDLDIAERLMLGSVDHLVARAMPAAEAWLVNLGDFFHADDGTNATPTNKHALDVDSRWPKIQQAGARIMRRIIERLLERHNRVVVKNVRGNHDPHSGYAMALILSAYYENEPRVEIDLEPGAFWYRSFGNTLIGVCHGHTVKKFGDLPGIMATDRPREWGAARHRRWMVGHHHHSRIEEFRGCVVEVFRTLAPADAWAQAGGYRSDRSLDLITIHKDKGERARLRVFFDEVLK